MTNGENVVSGVFGGPLGTLLAVQVGAVGATTLPGVACYAMVGATVGFFTTFFLKRLFKFLNIKND
jgi:hypothetical protein